MPQDLFEKFGIDPNEIQKPGQGRDLLAEQMPEASESMLQPNQPVQKQPINQQFGNSLLDKQIPVPEWLNNLVINPALGAGDEMAKMWSFGKLQPKSGEGLAYDIGKFGGGVLGYTIPSAILGAAAPVGSSLSELMAAKGTLGTMRTALGGGLAGAAVSPENRGLGFGVGAASGVAGQKLGDLLKAGPNAAKSIVRKVKDNLFKEKEIAKTLYDPIMQKFGKASIYEKGVLGKYENIAQDVVERHYSPEAEELHNLFKQNNDFGTAHNLQSEIGKQVGSFKLKSIKEGGLSGTDLEALKKLISARNLLKEDIKNMIGKMDPNYVSQYEKASEHYLNNVVPNKELFISLNKLGARPKLNKVIKIIEDSKHFNKPLPKEAPEYLSKLESAMTRQKLGHKLGLGAALGGIGLGYKGYKDFIE